MGQVATHVMLGGLITISQYIVRAVVLLAWLAAPALSADEYRSPTYAEFLCNPNWYAKDTQTRAYVRGAVDVLKYDRLCSDEAFRNAENAMHGLVALGKTTRGYIASESDFGGIRQDLAGALIVLAEQKGCKSLSR